MLAQIAAISMNDISQPPVFAAIRPEDVLFSLLFDEAFPEGSERRNAAIPMARALGYLFPWELDSLEEMVEEEGCYFGEDVQPPFEITPS